MSMRRVPETNGREWVWKLVSTVSGILGAMIARKLMKTAYRAIRTDAVPTTPFDPANARFSWPEALVWAAAAGIGLGIAKVVSVRVAAMGWEAATGTLPPGVVEEPAVV
jgi:hypothetical protein